jgi:hypothetical protein
MRGDSVIERSYPGVFVGEAPVHPTPIEGVPTTTAAADAQRHAPVGPVVAAPAWTDHTPAEPGVTLLQALACAFDAFVPGSTSRAGVAARLVGTGVLAGLDVDGQTPGRAHVPGGAGVGAPGRPGEPTATAAGRTAAPLQTGRLFLCGPFPAKCEGPERSAAASDVALETISSVQPGSVTT